MNEILELNKKSTPLQQDKVLSMLTEKKKKLQQKSQSRIYYDPSLFKNIIELPSIQSNRENLDNFKYACLKDKAILYEEDKI